jgi:nucleoid-associated protein YgaU
MSLNLRINNPYANGRIVLLGGLDAVLDRTRLNYVPSRKDKLHKVRDFDSLSDLAYDYYGDSKWWWVIYDINDLDDPFDLIVNTTLIIPDLERIKVSAL